MRLPRRLLILAPLLLAVPVRAALPDTTATPGLADLDQKVRVLERLRELDQEAAAAKAREAPVVGAGPDGFSLRSADGAYRLKVGGYVQADGRFWFDDPTRARINTFTLRRVRPFFDGTVARYCDFRIMLDLGGGTTVLQDAYLGLNLRPGFKVQAGKLKPPVGLERLQSGAALLFVERGLPTGLVPNRDLGVQVQGEPLNGGLTYAFGVFNGVTDGNSGDGDTNDGKDLVARLLVQPFKGSGSPLRGLGLGVGGTLGNQEGALPAYKTPGQVTCFAYGDSVVADGRRWRLAPQGWYYGDRWSLLGEYTLTDQAVARRAASAHLRHQAWQVAGSWLLTGGQTSPKGVSPRQPFDPAKRQWGAFELAARWHHLGLDRDTFPTFANPAKSISTATAWAGGVNWYLSRNAKVNLDYEQTRFDGGAANGDRDDERIVFTRIQVLY